MIQIELWKLVSAKTGAKSSRKSGTGTNCDPTIVTQISRTRSAIRSSPRVPRAAAVASILATVLGSAPAFAAPAEKTDFLPGCIPCHGLDGIGRDVEIPNLAGQNEVYLLNQLRAFHQGRRAHKEMLYMSRKMTEEDMRALAAYYASLPPR